MPVINLIIILAVIGLALWVAITYIPMEATIKKIMIAVVVIATILWLLSVFGILGSVDQIRVGR
jgi:ABC-type siderophore export system fused ATPase/permease subunit